MDPLATIKLATQAACQNNEKLDAYDIAETIFTYFGETPDVGDVIGAIQSLIETGHVQTVHAGKFQASSRVTACRMKKPSDGYCLTTRLKADEDALTVLSALRQRFGDKWAGAVGSV